MRVQDLSVGKMVITRALTKQPAKGLVYFLHGACDSGLGLRQWINKTASGNFAFRDFPVFYPTSPTRAYSLHDGKPESIWFDQIALNPNVPEDWGTISIVGSHLNKLIEENERENGIPSEKTIIGGFSMGGAMALHLGYGRCSHIAGVFALSSFLPSESHLFEEMDTKRLLEAPPIQCGKSGESQENLPNYAAFPKLFMSHGQHDPIVSLKWAKSTFNNLRKRGVDGHFYTMQNGQHAVSKQQLSLLHDWIEKTLTNKPVETPSAQNES